MNKKLTLITAIFVFVFFGLSLALAQTSNETDNSDSPAAPQIQKQIVPKIRQIEKPAARQTVPALIKNAANDKKPAENIREQHEQIKKDYANAKQTYKQQIDAYKNTRQDLKSLRDKFQKSKNAENRKAFEDKAKEHIKKLVESIIRRLEAFKKMAQSPKISDSDREEIISEIDRDIAWLNGQIENIDEATPEQIKEKAGIIKNYWRDIQARTKKITGLILSHRILFAIEKLENFAEKVEIKINELKSRGVDVSELERWLSDFKSKLSLAKDKYEAAKTKFKSISSLKEAQQLFKEGRNFIKEANDYLKEAHKDIVNITKEIKNLEKSSQNEGTEQKPTESSETEISE